METRSRVDHSSYLRESTIVAPITGSTGAISAIRVSGGRTVEVLGRVCSGAAALQGAPRQLKLVDIRNSSGRLLDQGLVAYFQEGASFTGEASAEFFIHGGGLIQGEVIRALLEAGCETALPGEFSFRAVRNGRMTMDQADAVRDLVEATNQSAHAMALDRLGGSSARLFEEKAEVLRRVLALAEAGIDFSDQDLDEVSLTRLQPHLVEVIEFLRRTERTLERGRRIQEGIHVALAGLPNAGKSTLFNELLGTDRSLISDEAGTTRDVIRERFRLPSNELGEEYTLWLHDTAGLRSDPGRVERLGIERTLQASREADLLLFVVDPVTDREAVLAEWVRLGAPREKTILVLHQADTVPSSTERARLEKAWREALEGLDPVWVSSKTQEGLPRLVERLADRCSVLTRINADEWVLTRLEQQEAVRKALESLERAASAPSHELFAADLREALEHLSFFIGKTAVDDILGRIFSQFCIGK